MTAFTRRIIFAALAAVILAASGCASTIPNRNPVGEAFPTVEGKSLSDKPYTLPADLAGEPAILLVGTVQDAQFDIDRWLYGITLANPPSRVLEVPTIRGLAGSMAKGFIDSGMRSGIPEEEWGVVVTVYSGASRIVEFTGNENPRNARVFLLDREGVVRWFHDRGYSATKMIELEEALGAISGPGGSE